MKAEISHLDSQISDAEEHLETQGLATKLCNPSQVHLILTKTNKYLTSLFTFFTEQSISCTWAQVEDSHRRELLLQAFRQRCEMGHKILSDDTQKIIKHRQELEEIAK